MIHSCKSPPWRAFPFAPPVGLLQYLAPLPDVAESLQRKHKQANRGGKPQEAHKPRPTSLQNVLHGLAKPPPAPIACSWNIAGVIHEIGQAGIETKSPKRQAADEANNRLPDGVVNKKRTCNAQEGNAHKHPRPPVQREQQRHQRQYEGTKQSEAESHLFRWLNCLR